MSSSDRNDSQGESLGSGRTAHSAFKIPVKELHEFLESEMDPNGPRAALIPTSKVVLWDEAPMANRTVLEAGEAVLKKIMGNDLPFGGKILILLGDFRQTCPVIKGGSKPEVIDASSKSSILWPLFNIYCLTEPIRDAEDPDFSAFVDRIGEGLDEEVDMSSLDVVTEEEDIIAHTFPDDILSSPTDCVSRSILAPTNIQVDRYNRIILDRIEGEQRSYFATNSMKAMNAVDAVPTEDAVDYMASFNMPGIPAHQLDIKVNGVYRLIRNLSIDHNLVKNTRVLITGLGQKIITVRRFGRAPDGRSFVDGEDILIPRITFEQKIRGLGFTLLRKQFPLAPAYATTFNSCQGLTLDCVGIDLKRAVFSHGQLYTAVSRVRRANALRIRLPPGKSTALNVTYHELLL